MSLIATFSKTDQYFSSSFPLLLRGGETKLREELNSTCTPPSLLHPSFTFPNSPSPNVCPRMYSPNLVSFRVVPVLLPGPSGVLTTANPELLPPGAPFPLLLLPPPALPPAPSTPSCRLLLFGDGSAGCCWVLLLVAPFLVGSLAEFDLPTGWSLRDLLPSSARRRSRSLSLSGPRSRPSVLCPRARPLVDLLRSADPPGAAEGAVVA